jgi:sugar-specific transcriptional regulator TrmB
MVAASYRSGRGTKRFCVRFVKMLCSSGLAEDHREILENLVFLGLTQTQARVYVASLATRNATAKQIAEVAGLNIAVTYRRIKELLAMRLLELRLGSPNRYLAITPDRALGSLLEKSETEVRYRRHLALGLGRVLKGLMDQGPDTKEGISEPKVAYRLLTGRKRLFDESQRLRNRTDHELLLIVPAMGLRRLVRHGYVHEARQYVRRGITMKIITEITGKNIIEADQLASLVSVRHHPKISFRLGIYDRETLHIGAAYDDDPLSDGSKDVYLIVRDKALAGSMALLFDAMWGRSVRPGPILRKLSASGMKHQL